MSTPCSTSASSLFSPICLRTAQAEDLPAITQCGISAFTRFDVFGPVWNSDSGVLPSLLCSLPESLSRIAIDEASGAVVGHAQWTFSSMHLLGQTRKIACLAPLSVHAQWQGQGIGSALVCDGIQALRDKGCDLLILVGHENYYPRFGLLTACHGRHALALPFPEPLVANPEGYVLRPMASGDELRCLAMWQELCGSTDGALHPGSGLLPWISKTRGIIACALERGGQVVGHARFDARPQATANEGVLRFLAADAASAEILAARIAGWTGWQAESLVLPLPSSSPGVQNLFASQNITPVFERWAPGMAMSLQQGKIDKLLRQIQAGEAPPLYLEWPPLFDY